MKWTEDKIRKTLRDAEGQVERGSATSNGPSLWQAEGRTDAANAKRFARMFGGRIRWIEAWGKWIIWNGKYWELDETCTIEALAKLCAQSIWGEAADVLKSPDASEEVKKEAVRHAKNSNAAAYISNMIRLTRSEPGIAIRPDQLDTDRYLLNCENGTLDLKDGTLRPHCQDDFITRIVPVSYDAAAECPLFIAFLERIFGGSKNLIAFVQRLLGHCLTGDVSEQILVIFHGSGANGKSTLVNILLFLLAKYAGKAAPQLLTAKSFDSHPAELADLFALRVAICNETEDGARFAEARVKELTGGERIKARRMRENHKPAMSGTDYATWRRIKLIPFNVTIPEGERDKHLFDKLKLELPGILAWLVAGTLAWQSEGLKPPIEVVAATQEYQRAEDTMAAFIAACCELQGDATESAGVLLDAYKTYTGETAMNPKRFAKMLGDRGFKSGRIRSGPNRGRMEWAGLRLAECEG